MNLFFSNLLSFGIGFIASFLSWLLVAKWIRPKITIDDYIAKLGMNLCTHIENHSCVAANNIEIVCRYIYPDSHEKDVWHVVNLEVDHSNRGHIPMLKPHDKQEINITSDTETLMLMPASSRSLAEALKVECSYIYLVVYCEHSFSGAKKMFEKKYTSANLRKKAIKLFIPSKVDTPTGK